MPEPRMETATNFPFPKQTELHGFAAAAEREVHVIPSGDVMTRLVPSLETATKMPFPKHTPVHELSSGLVREVHVTPSGEVMMRSPAPEDATATKSPLPQQIASQLFVVPGVA